MGKQRYVMPMRVGKTTEEAFKEIEQTVCVFLEKERVSKGLEKFTEEMSDRKHKLIEGFKQQYTEKGQRAQTAGKRVKH